MENPKKNNFFLSNWEFFVWNWEKNILFGIGNGAEFRPQNQVIKSPDNIFKIFVYLILGIAIGINTLYIFWLLKSLASV